ncbi:MAG: anti-sigma factor family protein [Candidatus Methylomirabilia bacterium]
MSPRTCRDVRADLSAYLDGDLDSLLTGEIRAHLENCAACRLELDQLRLTVGALRGLPDLPPPAAILAGVRSRLRPEPWYRRLRVLRQWPLGVPVGALATVLVVVGISLFQARYPDMSKTVPHGPFPQVPAPPARERPSTPTHIATNSTAARPIVAERQPGENLVFVPSQHVIPEPEPAAEPMFMTKGKESGVRLDRATESGAVLKSARFAAEKATQATWIEVVCLLPADGSTVDDIERLLRREGAAGISIGALEPPAVREAFAPHRLRPGAPPEPSRGWAVTASVPPHAFARVLLALSSRADLRILEQPARRTAPQEMSEPLDLRITVLR